MGYKIDKKTNLLPVCRSPDKWKLENFCKLMAHLYLVMFAPGGQGNHRKGISLRQMLDCNVANILGAVGICLKIKALSVY